METYLFNVLLSFASTWLGPILCVVIVSTLIIWQCNRYIKRHDESAEGHDFVVTLKDYAKEFAKFAVGILFVFGLFFSFSGSSRTYKHDDTYHPNEVEAQVEAYQHEMEQGSKGEITLEGALLPESSESRKARTDEMFNWKERD